MLNFCNLYWRPFCYFPRLYNNFYLDVWFVTATIRGKRLVKQQFYLLSSYSYLLVSFVSLVYSGNLMNWLIDWVVNPWVSNVKRTKLRELTRRREKSEHGKIWTRTETPAQPASSKSPSVSYTTNDHYASFSYVTKCIHSPSNIIRLQLKTGTRKCFLDEWRDS